MPSASLRELAPPERIQARVEALAAAIARDHGPLRPLTLMVVLRGAFVFAADLARALIGAGVTDLQIEFLQAASYRGTAAVGAPAINLLGPVEPHSDRAFLVVEDIVDAGRTIRAVVDRLAPPGRALAICALLDRPEGHRVPVEVRYVGFQLEGPGFVVGYGLDYEGRYRELPYLAQWLPPSGPAPRGRR